MAKQIQVTCGSVTNRKKEVVASNTTLRKTFEMVSIDYAGATIQVDGVNITIGDMDKTYEELGVTGDKCMLIAVVKADNA